MPEIQTAADGTIRTVRLTRELLRQVQTAKFKQIIPYLNGKKGRVLGWVDGKLIGNGEWQPWLLVQSDGGELQRCCCNVEVLRKYGKLPTEMHPQLLVS